MRIHLVDAEGTNGVQIRMWFATQEAAREANRTLGRRPGDFVSFDVDPNGGAVVAFLNEQARGRPEPFHKPRPVERPTPAPAIQAAPALDLGEPATSGRIDPGDVTQVVDAIRTSNGRAFARFLMAAVRRLGELGLGGQRLVNQCRDMGTLGDTFTRGTALVGAIALAELAGAKRSELVAADQSEGGGQ